MTNSALSCPTLPHRHHAEFAIRITRGAGVIRCLTIAAEDAPPITIAPITIALEHIMPGWPQRFLEEQIKRPTASLFAVEARP